MLNPRLKHRHSGLTLAELMIGIAVLAILTSLAMPSFRTMFLNTEIHNAADAILNGLQRARAEAVARNTNVTLVLGTNSAWTVNVVAPASTIESRLANEGSKNVTRTVLPLGATTVTYNNVGQMVTPNADGSAPLAQVDLGIDLDGVGGFDSHLRSLRITIGLGGEARMCNPTLTPPNPRAC